MDDVVIYSLNSMFQRSVVEYADYSLMSQ